jgi:surfeit locus 1 family protein
MTSRYPLALVLFSVVVGGVCLRLGFWQLGRLEQRRARNAVTLEQQSLPATDIRALAGQAAERRVFASGRFDFGREFVLRGRARDGVPGVEVVTPLVLAGSDSAVLVLRGYVPAADAITYDAAAHREPDSLRVSGIAMPVPVDSAGAAPATRKGAETWRRLDLASVRGRLPYPVASVYILADSPATTSPAPQRLPAPPLDDGPHLNYAIQWFAFATIAFGGALALLWRRGRERPEA